MEITYRKVGELVPYINNARTHSDEQVAQICASIREYGWTNPVLIDENGMIIAGHGRVMAAQRMKMEQVPCIVLSGLTEAQKKAYVIADNKMALNAGWDDEKLKLELENLKELDFDLELTGFDSDELDQLLSIDDIDKLPEDIDDVPEPPKEAKSKLGDIYKLGEHTLMCGDSTRKEDVDALVGGDNKVDLVFTDPPYNVNVENSEGMKIKNDLHPTMKPVSLCCRLIRLSTTVGERVLDLFGGSGSTLIACEQLKRKCFMMEFDPVYCDVIIERWERFTGRKAVKVNG